MDPSAPATTTRSGRTTLIELGRLFVRIGAVGFGGPAAHIALIRDEVVVRRRWLAEARFVDLLGLASLLPGPTSTELATAVGLERGGRRGMLVAGGSFILPAFVIVLALAVGYERFGTLPQAGAVLYGVQPAVVAVVGQAVIGLARGVLTTPPLLVVAFAVGLLSLFGAPPLLLLLGGAVGILLLRQGLALMRAAAVGLSPLGRAVEPATAAVVGSPEILVTLALVFLKVGLLVFGSGYVLLAFLREDLVVGLALVTDRQLLDAVAVGQLTPGPVFTTATFLGYLLAGVPGAVVATVAIFLPTFLLVPLVHPLLPRLRASARLSALLDGVNAAALGLMAGVLVVLARAAVVDVPSLLIGLGAFALGAGLRVAPHWLILGGGLAGLFAPR
jgi:chromate transporter